MAPKETTWTFQGCAETRLDKALAGRFPDISRAYLADLVVKGLARVNGRHVRKGHILKPGDTVTVESFLRPDERKIEPNPSIKIPVLFECPSFVVLDKPSGLPTHPNAFDDRDTLANALLALYPETAEVGDDPLRPGIVHRLDGDTSGVILAARTQEAFRALRGLFDAREISKSYLALVIGDVKAGGEVTAPIAHDAGNQRKMVAVTGRVRVRSRIREAKTLFEPVERFGPFTLLGVRTLTGRMHQVRVHMSSMGHPLAGDRLYQKPSERRLDTTGLERHFLHASEISFRYPGEEETRTFRSSLPSDLYQVLSSLRHISS